MPTAVTSSLLQLKVMSASRTVARQRWATRRALRGLRHTRSPTTVAATGTPECQGAAARQWMAAREAELLPIPTSMSSSRCLAIGDIAYQNKAVIYDLLFKASSETMLTIAADPSTRSPHRHHVGVTQLGSAMTHHPHLHMIVRAAGSPWMTAAGSHASQTSCCLCAFCQNCFGG